MIPIKDLPAPADTYPVRRALLSVFDKTGLVDFAQALHQHGVELVSTGGSERVLREAGLPVKNVSELTGFPEILDGRVKTLHPAVHGGLLSRRTDPDDDKQLDDHGINPIDLVVVNLYPFEEATRSAETTDDIAIENIDIGGPTMIRAAAKNFFFVGVATSPGDYECIVEEMGMHDGALTMSTRRALAHRAFEHTALYDRAVSNYFSRASATEVGLSISAPRASTLRYGENPHQSAVLYGSPENDFEKLHGKELSFNNLLDISAGITLIKEFHLANPTCAILKHTNPCGVATRESLESAYHAAFATDRQSPFGGIVVVNRKLDMVTAQAIDKVFTEIIIAPAYADGVLDFLMKKKNRRLIVMKTGKQGAVSADIRSVVGGFLVQDADSPLPAAEVLRDSWRVVTEKGPSEHEWNDLDFAWRIVKNVKSNAIVYVRDGATLGIGAGQMSRIDSSEIAAQKSLKSGLDLTGSVVASDAFFPFADGMLAAAKHGAIAVIQPGGSIRDDEVIKAANEKGIAMIFTGKRHFRH